MKEDTMRLFTGELARKLGKACDIRWDIDKKGVVCGWCALPAPDDIYSVAETVADFRGRVMTISPLNTPAEFAGDKNGEKAFDATVNYHFYFEGLNLTAAITLPTGKRTVRSITPVLKSADWHEREMRELFNIELRGHPDSRRLFLDEGIYMTDHTMIPLSEALRGASTNTLWEKIMKSNNEEADGGGGL